MAVLFVNAAFREGSRTLQLAKEYIKNIRGDVIEINLGEAYPSPLDKEGLKKYNEAVRRHEFDDSMFLPAKEFVKAEEIVIAAPFWNYGIPAVLHAYIELVCTQGISFDLDETGQYIGLCNAKKITFITTAGGMIPENNHAFTYIKDLAKVLWNIKDVQYIKQEGLDIK